MTAGVIGSSKLHYDIWGNTVNIASRMNTSGISAYALGYAVGVRWLLEAHCFQRVFWYPFAVRGNDSWRLTVFKVFSDLHLRLGAKTYGSTHFLKGPLTSICDLERWPMRAHSFKRFPWFTDYLYLRFFFLPPCSVLLTPFYRPCQSLWHLRFFHMTGIW